MKKILGIILALMGLLVLVFDHFFGTFLVPVTGSSLYKAGCFFGWLIGWGSLFASGIYLLFKTN
ncbi:MAG: hypothetical protein E7473_10665 [Ruminococcaceae bacterium]|nr:hypothetical protein [Oscillospiraceae bacterium]MBQ7119426.1 hypothetical protein [Oscillospiraceae bacterium]